MFKNLYYKMKYGKIEEPILLKENIWLNEKYKKVNTEELLENKYNSHLEYTYMIGNIKYIVNNFYSVVSNAIKYGKDFSILDSSQYSLQELKILVGIQTYNTNKLKKELIDKIEKINKDMTKYFI